MSQSEIGAADPLALAAWLEKITRQDSFGSAVGVFLFDPKIQQIADVFRAQATANAELRAEVARLREAILKFAEDCKDDFDSNTEGRGTQYKAGWKAGLEHLAAGLRVGVYNMSPTPKPLRKCEGCNALCEQGVCDDCSGVNIVAGWDAEMAMAIDPAPEVTL
jgi:hypothetical protein